MTEYSAEQVDDLIGAITKLAETREQSHPAAKAADGARYAAALDGSKEVADQLAAADEQKAAKAQADAKAQTEAIVRDVLKDLRSPSMAAAIGQGPAKASRIWERIAAHPALKASLGADYEGGSIFNALSGVRGIGGFDVEAATQGKAFLTDLGVYYGEVPGASKATLGETGAHGGFVLPNNLVDTVQKPATQKAVYNTLVTVRGGVAVRGVDQPFRTGAPARATFQDWGSTKENLDEAYGSYTANLGTIARIYDVGKQYARFSQGAAERDVVDELGKAVALGENFYIIAGAGTGSVGSGDPTLGVYTALNARPAFKAAFSAASTSTVAGSFASACATLMQNVAANNREVTAIVVDHITFFTALREGSDSAGFWVDPAGGPTGFTRTSSGALAYWGVPIYYDTNLGTSAATKIAIGAQWDAFTLYRGMEFRIDSSDVAGTRWDKNVIGYRGEEEIGFHAGSAAEVGAGFLLTAVIP